MKENRPIRRVKPYFCYDENLEFLQLKRRCGGYGLFISVITVMEKQGAKDADIIELCNRKNYHIVTHNTIDFKKVPDKIKIGIICVGSKNEEEWIPKFEKMMRKMAKHNNYTNKSILISNIITIEDRVSGETMIL